MTIKEYADLPELTICWDFSDDFDDNHDDDPDDDFTIKSRLHVTDGLGTCTFVNIIVEDDLILNIS